MKTVLHYLRPRLGIMSVGLLIKFFGTVAELLLPWMLSVILDEAVPAGALGGILFWGGLMVLCAAAALGGNVIANRLACSTSRDVTRRLRHDLFARVMQLSCAQEDAFTTPSLISRLTSDTYNVHQMVDRMQRLGVQCAHPACGRYRADAFAGAGAHTGAHCNTASAGACGVVRFHTGHTALYPYTACTGRPGTARAGEHGGHPRHPRAVQGRL